MVLGLMITPAITTADSDSDLMEAIRLKDLQRVNAALAKGASVNAYANSLEESYITPLMFAVLSGDEAVEIGKILIQKGADVNAKDLLGWTPLTYAAFYGRSAFTTLLLEKGADPNARSKVGWTPLMYAARSGQTEVGKLLIARGAVASLSSPDGKTALSIAESNDRSAFADLLKKLNVK